MREPIIIGAADAAPEEVAAALAAVSLLLAAEVTQSASPVAATPERWRDAARMQTQGLAPGRTPTAVRWNTIERVRRAGRGGSGITGN
jgi:hypothetical protein